MQFVPSAGGKRKDIGRKQEELLDRVRRVESGKRKVGSGKVEGGIIWYCCANNLHIRY